MEWMRVEDKIPDRQYVVLFIVAKQKHLGIFVGIDMWISFEDGLTYSNHHVTHWLKTPPIPSELLHGSSLDEE